MGREGKGFQLRCPACFGALAWLGSREIGLSDEAAFRRQHAYWCPAGCRGQYPDGTFEYIECPACGSHDTCSLPRGDGVGEVECDACGTIASLAVAP